MTLAIQEALKRNGFDKNVRAVSGYLVGRQSGGGGGGVSGVTRGGGGAGGGGGGPTAAAHAWLEVDGRVLDVVSDGLALCEAARRAGIDYSDERAMEEKFGGDVLRLGEYSPEALRPLTVLNVPVPVGGTATETLPRGLTMKTPPATVSGAAEAVALVHRYTEVLGVSNPSVHVNEMPAEVRDVYQRIAGIQLETVGHEKDRAARLQEAA